MVSFQSRLHDIGIIIFLEKYLQEKTYSLEIIQIY